MSSLYPPPRPDEPFVPQPGKGQLLAVAILTAGALAAVVWASRGAEVSAPQAAPAVRAQVSSDQVEPVRLHIRYAHDDATSDDAEKALSSAWRDFARLCGSVAA